jgi:hypothetical protein
MQLVDQINCRYDRGVFFAAEGTRQPWKMTSDNLSQRFTTRWEELLTISV